MAEENKGQEPEQEPVQGEEPAQEPEEAPQQEEEPVKEKGEGLLMPILYALLAGVGAFTLALIVGIVLTFFFRPAEPEETPSEEQSSQVTLTASPEVTETQAPQEPDGEDGGDGGDDGDAENAGDDGDTGSDAADSAE